MEAKKSSMTAMRRSSVSSTTTVVVVSSTVVVVGSIEVVLASSEVASTTVVVGDGSGVSVAVGDVDELEQPIVLSAPASTTPSAIRERWGRLKPAIFSARCSSGCACQRMLQLPHDGQLSTLLSPWRLLRHRVR